MEDLATTPSRTPPEFHPERFLDDALEDSITTLAANIAAATWQLLTCVANWRGERMDLDLAVLGLLQSDGRMGNTRIGLGSAS